LALSDLVSRITVNPLAASASRLEAHLAEAETNLSNKRASLDALLSTGEIDTPNVTKASDTVDSADRKVRNLRVALAAAQSKITSQQAETERNEMRAKWQAAVKAAEARHTAVEKLAASMKQFASDYLAALQANQSLVDALPSNPDSIASKTDRAEFETVLRKELARLGLSWCFSWPWGVVSLPELMPQFEGALEVVRRSVPKDAQ
jgi:chromosome segregation ATPase